MQNLKDTKSMNYKRKILKLDFMKFKHIVSSLYIAENEKTSHRVGKKYSHVSDKEVVSLIHKKLLKLKKK